MSTLTAGVTTMTEDVALPDLDELWDYNDAAGTEEVFRGLLEVIRADGNRDELAVLLTQIARTQGLQRRFEDAHRTLDEVELMLPEGVPRIRLLLERGRALNSSGEPAEARPLFERAYEDAIGEGADRFAVDAAHMVAIVAAPDEALEWNRRALHLAEGSSCPAARRWRGSLHNNIGWTRHGSGDFERALEHFRAALACREEQGTAGPIRIARWCIARCLRSLEQVDEALAMQQALARECEESNAPDGFVHEELAECLLAQGRAEEARPHFAHAHELLAKDPWIAEGEPERLKRLVTLAGS